jgi:16S rRNA (uracil1498-N3)-methyltransferase
MQLFYSKTINDQNTSFTFSKEESKHIVKVLRKKNNDLLHVTNGYGEIYTCKITLAHDKNCVVSIINKQKQDLPSYHLHVAIAPTKMNDRYEWFLEKATEIGINEITPIICDHSERKVVKLERLSKILESAMKQSLNAYLPILNKPIAFNEFVSQNSSSVKYIAHCEDSDKISLKQALKPETNILILIGPEGDFSQKEIDLAASKKFQAVSLGKTRLRTETAGVIACHSVAFVNE